VKEYHILRSRIAQYGKPKLVGGYVRFGSILLKKDFLSPEQSRMFFERARIENIDSSTPYFGFYYCLSQRVAAH
jgi:hypothetical protein